MKLDRPIFVMTSDVDWAADACIADIIEEAARFEIHIAFMATGESAELRRRAALGQVEIGIHPNFLPGSTHGSSVEAVISTMTGLFPEASFFRSHSFVDGAHITSSLKERGVSLRQQSLPVSSRRHYAAFPR